ncbi:MAG: transposase [Pseudomonadota bacterium]
MSPELPVRCTRCLSLPGNHPCNGCQVCRDQAMAESFLCGIARRATGSAAFVCEAFRPHLSIVGKSGPRAAIEICQDKETYFNDVVKLIGSGPCAGKGCTRPSCQGGERKEGADRFHVVWVVHQRKPLFADSSRFVSFLHDVFLSCGNLMAGKVLLLWLAPDHLHLYIESSPRENVEDLVEDLQGLVQDTLLQEFADLRRLYEKKQIWEREFFVEQIG